MTKSGRRPAAAASRRSTRTQKLWKVDIQLAIGPPLRRASVRAFISPAALFVKVTARIRSEGTPWSSTRWAMRWVMTRVFPLPAPARMRTGPSVASTASRCCGLRPARKGGVRGKRLLDRDRLREVAGLVDVAPGPDRQVVGQELQGQDHQERRPELVFGGDLEDRVPGGVEERTQPGVGSRD